jgi:hypothetical protein
MAGWVFFSRVTVLWGGTERHGHVCLVLFIELSGMNALESTSIGEPLVGMPPAAMP